VDERFFEARGVPSLRVKESEECWRCNAGGKDTPMKSIHQGDRAGEEHLFDLDEIARQGASDLTPFSVPGAMRA
jgi:hypothetical protein